jgi:inositol oxygenase
LIPSEPKPFSKEASFRDYSVEQKRHAVVRRHYEGMRRNQTVAFHERMVKKFGKFDHAHWTVWEAFDALGTYVDSADPDVDTPNIEHGFQTAESARAAGEPDWVQLVGLIHDLGKVMFAFGGGDADGHNGTAEGDQWGLGGDTWVVGCKIPDTVVFPEFNNLNPDMADPRYNTALGMYKPHCGIANLKFTWNHDEYLYQMLVHNQTKIPAEGLDMIRYHSCYPWHRENEYSQLTTPEDEEVKRNVVRFNQYDLYSKVDKRPDIAELRPYYEDLVNKYMPGKLGW